MIKKYQLTKKFYHRIRITPPKKKKKELNNIMSDHIDKSSLETAKDLLLI